MRGPQGARGDREGLRPGWGGPSRRRDPAVRAAIPAPPTRASSTELDGPGGVGAGLVSSGSEPGGRGVDGARRGAHGGGREVAGTERGNVSTADFEYELPPGRIARYPGRQARGLATHGALALGGHHPPPALPGPARTDARGRPGGRQRYAGLPGAAAGAQTHRRRGGGAAAPAGAGRRRPGMGSAGAPRGGSSSRAACWSWRRSSPCGSWTACADGRRIVRLEGGLGARAALERFGEVPLPPYLEREEEPSDRARYQTVYARHEGVGGPRRRRGCTSRRGCWTRSPRGG